MSASGKRRDHQDAEEYLSRYKLKEIFQGLLRRMVVQQPDDPLQFMHEEVSKIKQEMEESHIDIGSTTFLTTQYPPTER